MRSKPNVIETIQGYCGLFSGGTIDVIAAAQRFGMHLVDDKQMAVTFTPRDRAFSRGIAVRQWRTNNLSGIELDVETSTGLSLSKLRDSFGPFKPVARMHPGDDYELVASWPAGAAKATCRIVVALRASSASHAGHEQVQRVSIGR